MHYYFIMDNAPLNNYECTPNSSRARAGLEGALTYGLGSAMFGALLAFGIAPKSPPAISKRAFVGRGGMLGGIAGALVGWVSGSSWQGHIEDERDFFKKQNDLFRRELSWREDVMARQMPDENAQIIAARRPDKNVWRAVLWSDYVKSRDPSCTDIKR